MQMSTWPYEYATCSLSYLALCVEVGVILSSCLAWLQPLDSFTARWCFIADGNNNLVISVMEGERNEYV